MKKYKTVRCAYGNDASQQIDSHTADGWGIQSLIEIGNDSLLRSHTGRPEIILCFVKDVPQTVSLKDIDVLPLNSELKGA